jgi:uncharacterized protein YxjI
MRYLLRQKLIALGDDFYIENEQGERVFHVDGRAFSIGDKLSFQDAAGNELLFIKQRLLAWGPTYEFHRGGDVVAVVKKKHFTLFRAKFSIDVPGPDDLEAKGSFLDLDYKFYRGDREVAAVSKSWFSIRDSYGVEIAPGEDEVLILASAVVIDMISHDDQGE